MADEEKTEENEDAEEQKPKGSKKLLVIGLLVGLLLGGGGGAGAFLMLGGGEEGAPEEEEVVEEEPEEEVVIDYQYVKIEHFTMPIVHNKRVIGHTILNLNLEVEGVENKLLVVRNLPVIRDKMLRLISVTAMGQPDNPYKINFPLLKEKFKEVIHEVTKKDVILQVLIVDARRM